MTTYLLTQHDLPPKRIEAACIHTDDDFVRFHDADHGLVYAVQRGLLLAIETVADQDSSAGDALTGPPPTVTVGLDGPSIYEAAVMRGATTINRSRVAEMFGWSIPQVNGIPNWLVTWLLQAN